MELMTKYMLVISAPLWKGGRQREETQTCEFTSFVWTTVDKRLFQTIGMVGPIPKVVL